MNNLPMLLLLLLGSDPVTVQYAPDSSLFFNPERGQMSYLSVKAGAPQTIDPDFLEREKQDYLSISSLGYVLDSFMTIPISTEFLDRIGADLAVIRQQGFKVVLRFSYSDSHGGNPPWNDSPPKELILQHIDQLAPILQANKDVILLMQAGFSALGGRRPIPIILARIGRLL